MPELHASLGASSADRWFACPGSVALCADLPDTANVYAHEGTCAHYFGEVCLNEGCSPDSRVGETFTLPEHDRSEGMPDEFVITKDMALHVGTYVDFCNAFKGDRRVEERLDYSRWVPGGFGTGDFLCFDESTGVLHVVDLKYGQGVKVFADNNKQMSLYGLGAYDLFSLFDEVLTVSMTIVQPRLDHIDTFEMSVADLLKFGKKAGKKAKATMQPDAPLVAGEKQCKWCKYGQRDEGCPAFDQYLQDEALDGFPIFADDPDELDVDAHLANAPATRLEKLIRHTSMVTSVLKKAKERAEQKLLAGEDVQGLKMVRGRSSKQYTEDDDEILRRLKNLKGVKAADVEVKKVITPAVAFKLKAIPERWRKKYIYIAEGKLTVVPEDDSREGVSPAADALEGF